MAVGSSVDGVIDFNGDYDYYSITLVAGQSYLFTLNGSGGSPLSDPYLELYRNVGGPEGDLVGFDDDGGGNGNAALHFTATLGGAYFISAEAFSSETGGYTLSVATAPPQNPLDTIDWGTHLTDHSVRIYFANSGESFGGTSATQGWSANQIAAVMAAGAAFSAVAGLTFTQVLSVGQATMVMVLDSTMAQGVLGEMDTPPTTPTVGVFNPTYLTDAEVLPGGVGFATILHEMGHGLGLAHPHDNGGASQVMDGVEEPFDSLGTFGLNQGVFTVMTYNDGFPGAPGGNPGTNLLSGYQSTPGALDVAVLQNDYGAVSHNTGDDLYALEAVSGRYVDIWDTGGNDTISYAGSSTVIIDLRTASLLNAIGGGGYVSRITPIYDPGGFGGYTIAAAVIIENAIGGSANDTLMGNLANNSLSGGAGNDLLTGGLGNDALIGGSGTDTAEFSGNRANYTITVAPDSDQTTVAGPDGVDTLTGVELLQFNDQTTQVSQVAGGPPTILITTNYAIHSTDTLSFSNQPAFNFQGNFGGSHPTVTNTGNISVTTNSIISGSVSAFHDLLGGLPVAGSLVWNQTSGVVSVAHTGAAGNAIGFQTRASVTNDGTVTVTSAHTDAIGDQIVGDFQFVFTNNGVFSVSGVNAKGVENFGGGVFINNGILNVASHGAGAGFGVNVSFGNFSITNTGTITVSDQTASADSIGIWLNVGGGDQTSRLVTNSGTITADDAIAVGPGNSSAPASYLVTNQATGVLNGNVVLLSGNDTFNNNGTIHGTVYLGGGNNTYNGQSGHVTGPVYGGIGNNTIYGGGDNEIIHGTAGGVSGQDGQNLLFGNGGDDQLYGGNNDDQLAGGVGVDSLSGLGGDDVLIGGAGDDTLDGGQGADTAAFSGNRAAYTITTSNGVTTVVGVDGTDILNNIEYVRFDDQAVQIGSAGGGVTVTALTTVALLNDYTVHATDSLLFTNQMGFQFLGSQGNNSPSLYNSGLINVVTGGNYTGDVYGFGGNNGKLMWNKSAGAISVTNSGPSGAAYGFVGASYSLHIVNDGVLTVSAVGGAAYGSISGNVFDNRGVVTISGKNAYGVSTDGSFINSGLLQVSAHGAGFGYGVQLRYVYYSFNNSGTITVTDQTATQDNIGIYVAAYSIALPTNLITNSGTITADYAIKVIVTDSGGSAAVSITNQTTGILNGKVLLGEKADVFNNYGTINGDVLLGDGNNTFNGVSGQVNGTIYGGRGSNTITGGTSNDIIYGTAGTASAQDGQNQISGGVGNDQLIGGGNADQLHGGEGQDVLSGLGGNDLLDGGAGDDTLDGGLGSDTARYTGASSGVAVSLAVGGSQATGGAGTDTLINIENLTGSAFTDTLTGDGGANVLSGGDGADRLSGGLGNDTIDGGSNVDTAILSGIRSAYVITHTGSVATVVGPDGTDTLTNVEFLQFDDQTVHFRAGVGTAINFNTADPATYMGAIRDFDGNDLGSASGWLRIGQADIQGDGDIEQILVNRLNGRWASLGPADDGLVYFDDHGWAGDTRVVGVYIDPLVTSGNVVAGSDNDSQRRFQNDLNIENIHSVLGAGDYDHDGLQEVYFSLTDGTAYLHAYMHADGNIRYANYQSQQQVIDYLTGNGFGPSTYAGWFDHAGAGLDSGDHLIAF